MTTKRVRDPRAGRGLRKSKTPVLDRLDSAEAAGVLRSLLAAHPELGSEAEQIAKSSLQGEGFESIAEEIEQSMLALDIDDLNRVKRSKGGDLAQWAPDFMAEAAGDAINTWLTGSRAGIAAGSTAKRARPSFTHGFVERFVPEWQDMIRRILTRTRR